MIIVKVWHYGYILRTLIRPVAICHSRVALSLLAPAIISFVLLKQTCITDCNDPDNGGRGFPTSMLTSMQVSLAVFT